MYRLLFLDGRLVDTVRRRAPTVTGDGRSSVLDLILAENRRRLHAERPRSLMTLDLDSILSLEAQGMSASSVPAAGQVVAVKSTSSDNGERDNHTIRDVSPAVVEESGEGRRRRRPATGRYRPGDTRHHARPARSRWRDHRGRTAHRASSTTTKSRTAPAPRRSHGRCWRRCWRKPPPRRERRWSRHATHSAPSPRPPPPPPHSGQLRRGSWLALGRSMNRAARMVCQTHQSLLGRLEQ